MTQHVIIGGGPAATNAVETIRQMESEPSQITMVCDEPAHSRMALPYWLAGKIPRQQTYTGDDDYFRRLQVTTMFNQRVQRVDPEQNSIQLNNGDRLAYDQLLIATGSSPVAPPIDGSDLAGVQPLWTLADTQRALDGTQELVQPRVVMVGAGFIGFIMLNAMFKRGWDLTVVEREPQVLPRMLDGAAGQSVQRWLAQRQVNVHTGSTVTAIQANPDGSKAVQLDNGVALTADLVVLATGIRANLEIVQGTPIATDQAILVNDRMQTNYANIYAAGDVAQGPVLYSDQPAVHAIQPTAVDHGRIAGANMAGLEVHYPGSLSMNIVDVCGLQCASYGAWDDATAEAMTIDHRDGFIYRKLLWRGDQMVGAIFTGRSHDLGMLTDLGMVKGILQTQTPLGSWKDFLRENPFDIRRAYIASGVAQKLIGTTLLGQPSRTRQFQYGGAKPSVRMGPAHQAYVSTKPK